MPAISTALCKRLSDDAGVSAIVGTRIFPENAQEADKTYPLIVYTIEGVTSLKAHDGPIGLQQATAKVAAVAKTYAEASDLSDAINACLDTVRGTWNGVVVQGCFLEDDGVHDDVVKLPESEDLTLYVKASMFDLTYET